MVYCKNIGKYIHLYHFSGKKQCKHSKISEFSFKNWISNNSALLVKLENISLHIKKENKFIREISTEIQ